jgi:hypothetical protein
MKAEAEAVALMKANPYRIAKEKSISVDEAKALIEKAKEKNQKQLEKVGGKAPEPEAKKSSPPKLEHKKKIKETHRVKESRPIAEGGGKYKASAYWKERKAAQARKDKAKAARKAAAGQRQGGSGAKKSTKGKSKKK